MAGRRRRSRSTHPAADGRIRLLQVVLALAFVVVVGKAFALTASSSGLSSIAQRQAQQTVALPAHRGDIVDRGGTPLAVGTEQQTVWATPRQLKDPVGAARSLAAVLHVSRAELEKEFLQRDSWYACVARQIDPELAKEGTRPPHRRRRQLAGGEADLPAEDAGRPGDRLRRDGERQGAGGP